MGDVGDYWNDVRVARQRDRADNGIECPRCRELRPRTNASILLPGQQCRVDGYVDPRQWRRRK
jgi:hypothetical protein